MAKCDGCGGDFEAWELVTSSDCNKELCLSCTYEHNANLDEMTDE